MATDTLTDTPEAPPATLTALAPLRPHRITVEEYLRMADAGVFGPEPKLELIEGVIVDKMTKETPHNVATMALERWLHRNEPAGSFAVREIPLTIAERLSEPEPDAMIVRGDPQDFSGRRVTPADILFAVEVAVSSLQDDRGIKRSLYAAVGIPVYWIVDVLGRRLEVYTKPLPLGSSGYYSETRIYTEDEHAPFEIEGREVSRLQVRDILPRV
jgi:Uma2 family endonuclease